MNHESLNPNAQKRVKNGSNTKSGSRGRTLKKMPGFVRPSELKNNLIKLLKQKREEKAQMQKQIEQHLETDLPDFLNYAEKNLEVWCKDTLAGLHYLLGNKEEAERILLEIADAEGIVDDEGRLIASLSLKEIKSGG